MARVFSGAAINWFLRVLACVGRYKLPWLLWRLFPSAARLRCYRGLASLDTTVQIGGSVCKLPCGWVLKTVYRSPFLEAENSRFVERNTFIPVPHILDSVQFFQIDDFGRREVCGVIVMEFVEGETLEKWIRNRIREEPERIALLQELGAAVGGSGRRFQSIMAKVQALPPPVLEITGEEPLLEDLRRAIHELRSLLPPSGAISGLNGRPLSMVYAGETRTLGPFSSHREFRAALFALVSPFVSFRIPALRRLEQPVLEARHRTCFTHGDLHGGNVLVKNGRLAAIFDWECAGWLPEYWEMTSIESHISTDPVSQQFWDKLCAFGPDAYQNELALEFALWVSTGLTLIMGPDDLICPRVREVASKTLGDIPRGPNLDNINAAGLQPTDPAS